MLGSGSSFAATPTRHGEPSGFTGCCGCRPSLPCPASQSHAAAAYGGQPSADIMPVRQCPPPSDPAGGSAGGGGLGSDDPRARQALLAPGRTGAGPSPPAKHVRKGMEPLSRSPAAPQPPEPAPRAQCSCALGPQPTTWVSHSLPTYGLQLWHAQRTQSTELRPSSPSPFQAVTGETQLRTQKFGETPRTQSSGPCGVFYGPPSGALDQLRGSCRLAYLMARTQCPRARSRRAWHDATRVGSGSWRCARRSG